MMKRAVILLLIAFISAPALAQRARLDSLLHLLHQHHAKDARRVQLLNQVVRTNFYINPFEGERQADEAVAIARELDDALLLGTALSLKVGAHQAQYTIDDQGPVIEEAIRWLERSGDAHELAWARYRKYQNEGWNNRRDPEKSPLSAALVVFRKVGDVTGEAFVLNAMANAELGEDPNGAERKWEQALKLTDRPGHYAGHALLLLYYANFQQSLGNSRAALEKYGLVLEKAHAEGASFLEAMCRYNIGTLQWDLGNYPLAMDHYMAALKLNEIVGFQDGICATENNIGCLYREMGDLEQALHHFQRSYEIALRFNIPDRIIAGLNDIGLCDLKAGDAALALEKFSAALERCPEVKGAWGQEGYDYRLTEAYRNIGSATIALGDMTGAITAFGTSVATADAGGLQLEAAKSRIQYADALIAAHEAQLAKAGRDRAWARATAIGLYSTAADSAEANGWLNQRRDALQGLANVHELMGDRQQALHYLKEYLVVKDSLLSADKARAVSNLQIQYETEKKEQEILLLGKDKEVQAKEIQKQKLVRNGFIGGFGLVGLFALVFFFQRNRISKARKRSDELLLNILPAEVAEELKSKGEAEAVHIDQVTVLFTDFKGFTAMSEVLTPKQLVKDLHECFSAFDLICEKHGLEKIKTIGDAYMAAGGLPTPNTTHATDVINAALEMRDFTAEGQAQKIAAGLPYFEIRIGVHTGPVVAGIVGVKKFQYDIWGDTVNTASRMESSGEVGQVNISGATYALVREQAGRLFDFTPRGKVQAKGKGEMEMYFVGMR